MNIDQELSRSAILMTVVTTILLGVIYPLAVTGLAQALFHDKANGQLIERNGRLVGSRIIGQAFSSPGYFHGRPSAAGSGYDAANSSGTNLGPTNKKLVDAVTADVDAAKKENPAAPVPVDLVTTSASGLDPDISPAAALFQVPRVARERKLSEDDVRRIVAEHTEGRQLGLPGRAARERPAAESRARRALAGSVLGEPIADPGLGPDVLRLRGIALYLAAERVDQHSQVLGLIDGVRTPDGLQDDAMREHAARVLREEQQQLELLRRQPDLLTRARDAVPVDVDREIAAHSITPRGAAPLASAAARRGSCASSSSAPNGFVT